MSQSSRIFVPFKLLILLNNIQYRFNIIEVSFEAPARFPVDCILELLTVVVAEIKSSSFIGLATVEKAAKEEVVQLRR